MIQKIIQDYDSLHEILSRSERILFIHGRSSERFARLNSVINSLASHVIHFTDYTPNPRLEDAENAAKIKCDVILSAGGGSAIDVSKYAKLKNEHAQLIVIPTTAGSGSEATRFAVIYDNGKKLSLTDDSMIPGYVMFDPELLRYMPEYVKKSSALDAFSHALESFWSVNANPESRKYSHEALSTITRMLEDYPESYDYETMQRCAYTAGRAINISQTTAGHAMSYKLTGIFGIAHGHSTALCNRVLFPYLVRNTELEAMNDIAHSMNCETPEDAVLKYERITDRMNLKVPKANSSQIEELVSSVNPERLKNFPVSLNENMIRELYREILKVRV